MAPTVTVECTKEKGLKRCSRDHSFAMMGKSQFSRGHSSGFVPDYRHAVETVGESDGLGSSHRVDSEDSCTPKRKCISLNVHKHGDFNVPLQVISTSKLYGSKRKELEMKLRAELEQVHALQKRIRSWSVTSNGGVALSSSSNGHAKKRDIVGHNGPQLKRGVSGRFESTNQPPPPASSSDMLLMKQCEQLLKRLMGHHHAWVFNKPVDVVKLKIPDYHTVIKHPMDLGTIKSKIASGAYPSPWGFVADVRLTFTNAMTYNPPANDVHIMADLLSKWFEQRWKPIEKKLAATDSNVRREAADSNVKREAADSNVKREATSLHAKRGTADSHVKPDTEAVKTVPHSKKRKGAPSEHVTFVPERVKPKMTVDEKQTLGKCLESLLADLPEHIIEFLRSHGDNVNQANGDEIEIDIDSLSDDTLFRLRKLLDEHLREKQAGEQAKSEPREIEVQNGPDHVKSLMHPRKGSEPADEDVDIGVNDPPIPSYPPVEIEKDIAPRSSKCSSSSSSSSDSGSSSDSDSDSSSGSESNDKVAIPTKTAKQSVGHEASMAQENCDIKNPLDVNRTINETEAEHAIPCKPSSVETDGCPEGEENAPSERQVSPEKLYRAALLRSRFADTILKAREKTLDQGEKGDPEKLRREREELERQQREERARLQAEAEAAEEARRRAEAEAAAEAKRKRECEREAARQALLKIEKTVDINENSLILKDLEMLGSVVPGEHLLSSVDETSPDQLQDAMGGFKLGGSNTLEQLGLFMKVDDEEEEDAEPSSGPTNDIEDGEID